MIRLTERPRKSIVWRFKEKNKDTHKTGKENLMKIKRKKPKDNTEKEKRKRKDKRLIEWRQWRRKKKQRRSERSGIDDRDTGVPLDLLRGISMSTMVRRVIQRGENGELNSCNGIWQRWASGIWDPEDPETMESHLRSTDE
ncbi:hypothetical protein WN51_06314 [Melipona quadrifasciata]|uniref:Uncharacterized protein n=1 Tax=Melipona quadrifasciata TaxID=166423 RepID=A0A0N0BCL6_9HYME|nr:hypothetical protein WN51_06314 [Melipona quadrifasciata]